MQCCDFALFRLILITALCATGVASGNTAQAADLWTPDPMLKLTEDAVPGNPPGEVEPIELVAPRNGVASGAVVVVAGDRLERVQAAASALRHEEGGATIPPQRIEVRYATRSQSVDQDYSPDGDPGDAFNHLLDRHVPDTRIQPVWFTVNVPADATPGTYRGTARVQPGGTVPIKLTVTEWESPDPIDFTPHVGLLHSPDTIARHYEVDKWSQQHFALMRQSLELLGHVGNNTLYLPMVNKTHFGNNETIVRWVPHGDGHRPDFTALDHYLRLYDHYAGEPSVFCLYMWENAWRDDRAPETLEVTGFDPQGGGKASIELPYYGEEGSEDYWRPLIEGIKQRIEAIGWDTDVLMIGVVGDGMPNEQTRAFFDEVAPDVKWASFTHARGHASPQGGVAEREGLKFGYRVLPYAPRMDRPRDDRYLANWRQDFLQATSMRSFNSNEPVRFRYLPYGSIAGGTRGHNYRGFDRIGMDFWSVDGGALIGNYHRWHNLYRGNHRAFTAPGPRGAMGSVLIEKLREGLQETEAQIAIERVMLDDELRDELDSELRERIESLLRERSEMVNDAWDSPENAPETPWREQTEKLFDLASKVEQTAGSASP